MSVHRTTGLNGMPRLTRKRPAAFTFIEVLFAIMVLGIGFIMIAAIFPVALKQSQATSEDTISASLMQNGVKTITHSQFYDPSSRADLLYTEYDLKTPNPNNYFNNGCDKVFSFNDPRFKGASPWFLVRDSMIAQEMPSFAWVPFYRRAVSVSTNQTPPLISRSPVAQVMIIPLTMRTRDIYLGTSARDGSANTDHTQITDVNAAASPATLDPLLFDPVKIYSTTDANGVPIDVADFSSATILNPGATAADALAVGEGSVIVVSDDRSNAYGNGHYGWTNGLMFRLGKQEFSVGKNAWQLSQATRLSYHMDPNGNQLTSIGPAAVFVIGRGWSTIARDQAGGAYDGKAQEIAFTTTVINVAPNTLVNPSSSTQPSSTQPNNGP